MDPKETIPENQEGAPGVPDLSQFFAKVDPLPSEEGDKTPNLSGSPEEDFTQENPKLSTDTVANKGSDDLTSPPQNLGQQGVDHPSQTASSSTTPQMVEKIVYKHERFHGFFRTLSLIALLFVGVLMLLESLHIFSLNIAGVNIDLFYPIFIILSVIIIWSYKGLFGKIFGSLMFLGVVAGFFVISVYTSLSSNIINNTGSVVSFPVFSGDGYSKVYVSTLINSLTIGSQTGGDLLSSTYDIKRPLTLISGNVESSHSYAILQETNNINLLEGLYSRLNIGFKEQQPLYLYIKTLLSQNTLDMTNISLRGLRVHGGIMLLDITVGSGQTILFNPTPLSGTIETLITTGDVLSGSLSGTGLLTSGTDLLISGTIVPILSGLNNTIKLDLQAAVANIILHLPKEVGVRMHYKSYIGISDFAQITQKSDTIYESENIDDATIILDINALFGVSKFSIIRDM